jgi:hypothetical protein
MYSSSVRVEQRDTFTSSLWPEDFNQPRNASLRIVQPDNSYEFQLADCEGLSIRKAGNPWG